MAPPVSRHPDLHAGFANPQPEFSPVPIWWWSGEPVRIERLRWQLDQLVDQGVFNVVIINLAPTGPSYGSLADEPALLSDEWWELWRGLCEHARERGARLWFYDQIGFSGANLQGTLVTDNPDFAGASVERVVSDVDPTAGDQLVRLECPPAGVPIAAAVLPLDSEGNPAGPATPLEIKKGRVEHLATRRSRVMLAYSLRRGFDYTSPRACAALMDIVHGEFARRLGPYLGNVIAGSFQDELPSVPAWSPYYAEEFAKRRGYRIEPVIAALWEDWGVESARVRVDYQRVRSALAEEAFFQPLHDWHSTRGMTVGVDQQSPSRAGEPIGCTQQYADYARTHRWYSAPGSDHWGDAKIHSSLAHHYDRSRTWIESFHSTGWGGTLEETFDWLQPWLLAGATLYNPHAVYYSTRAGWWEWAPPSTCFRQPYWRHYRTFADTVSRLCWLLTRGEHSCDVGVLFPSSTVAAGTLSDGVTHYAWRAHRDYLNVVGQMPWFNVRTGALGADRRDFDVLDDDTIATAVVRDGALHTRGEKYRAVVVPSSVLLEADTARRLVEFAEDGGILAFVGALPEHADVADGDSTIVRLRELVEAGKAQHLTDSGDLPAALDPLGRPIRTDAPFLHRHVDDQHLLVVSAATEGSATAQPMLDLTWSDDGEDIDIVRYNRELREHGYDFDPARNRPTSIVEIDGTVGDIEQWDPVSGAVTPATVRVLSTGSSVDGSTSVVTVDFSAAPLAVLIWSDSPARQVAHSATDAHLPVAGAPATLSWEERALDGPWESAVVPTLDNRHGDFSFPACDEPLPVRQWRPRHTTDGNVDLSTVDTGSWTETPVTYGTFAWRTDPIPDTALPEPLPTGHQGPLVSTVESGWKPVDYSLSKGIELDPFHTGPLGPKGRVPEEFWHVDDVPAGHVVRFRTTLPLDSAGEITLALSANGAKSVRWNGEPLPTDPGGYHRLDAVASRAGTNILEFDVRAESTGALRGSWALTENPLRYARPEWISPADGAKAGTQVVIGTTVTFDQLPERAVLHLGTEGSALFTVNGAEIGVQGAFDPYATRPNPRVLPYDVTARLRTGENRLEIVFTDAGGDTICSTIVDALFVTADGTETALVSHRGWESRRDGEPVGTVQRRRQAYDPRWALLRPRPHPLPRTGWLDPEQPLDGVLDIVPDAFAGETVRPEFFALDVPPGATRVRLPLSGAFTVRLDGAELSHGPRKSTGVEVDLPRSSAAERVLVIAAEALDGSRGGARWDGPAEFDCETGTIELRPWAEVGLGSYSGGISYTRDFDLDELPREAVLDLGALRGTAQVELNGQPVGNRIWSPYRFTLTDHLRQGRNHLTISVFNTLGPHFDDNSPTAGVYRGQRDSGLTGPVRLVLGRDLSVRPTPGAAS